MLSIVSLAASSKSSLADDYDKLDSLWLDVSLGPPLVDLFNERAQADDIARVEHISQIDLLSDINSGKKLVVFKSAEDAIRLLPHIKDEIDIVGYNLEHGPANPENEQKNPVASIKQLKEVADSYDLEVALGPDHDFALSDGAQMAPYTDYFILQIQKVQTEPDVVYDFVLPIIEDVRKANPDIEISVQIRTEGSVEDLLSLLEPLQGKIDGLSILTSVDTVDFAEELIGELREELVIPVATPKPAVPVLEPFQKTIPGGIDITTRPTAAAIAEANQTTSDVENNEIIEDANDIEEVTLDAIADDGILSTPEENTRIGSTWLFVTIALILGIALGAGYASYRKGS